MLTDELLTAFPKRTKRETIELEVMQYLNSRNLWHTHIFDCGGLGILAVYWIRNKWESGWLDIKPLPEELKQYC